jgi:putative membrane protein
VTTLVVCLDRTDDVGRKTGLRSPIVGWEAVRALVTDVGLADPEDSGVNSLLETLRVAQSLRDENEDVVVAVVSGDRESMVSADRSVARQVDDLMAAHDPDSAVVVIDSAEDERLVPIVESRVQVDSVDRVVVRQARDIESTYYLLKQFLADEELRQTVLVPIGLTLLVFPMLAWFVGPAEGAAAITTVIGLFLLYKGFNVDEVVTGLALQIRESLYSGQVSVVTYAVAAGLTLVGVFVGVLGVSNLEEPSGVVLPAVQFAFDSAPWLAAAALTASAGRLLDEAIGEEPIGSSYLNLPFIVVSVGLVIRGFSAYFLEQQALIESVQVPAIELGVLSIDTFGITAGERLALYVVSAIVVSLVGAKVAATFSGDTDRTVLEDVTPESGLTDGGPRSQPADGQDAGRDESDTDSGRGNEEGSGPDYPR